MGLGAIQKQQQQQQRQRLAALALTQYVRIICGFSKYADAEGGARTNGALCTQHDI